MHDLLATRLVGAHRTGTEANWEDLHLETAAEAYAAQYATISQLGSIGGWKVGAKGPTAEPILAPLPSEGLLASGTTLSGPNWRLRGVEVELALRLGRDLDRADAEVTDEALATAVDAVLPVIEIVETRLKDWPSAPPLVKLADLQSHGALVLGAAIARPRQLSLRDLRASLAIDGQVVAATHGGNPAGDVWRLLRFLASSVEHMPRPAKAGDIIATGSCTGLLFAGAGQRCVGTIEGLGEVACRF
jgi:2-keto-4-pentenoate hydratase